MVLSDREPGLEGRTGDRVRQHVALKPSPLTPAAARALAANVQEAGIPRGVFNFVYGDAVTGHRDLGQCGARWAVVDG